APAPPCGSIRASSASTETGTTRRTISMALLPIGNRLRRLNDPKIVVSRRWAVFTPIEERWSTLFSLSAPRTCGTCATTSVLLHVGRGECCRPAFRIVGDIKPFLGRSPLLPPRGGLAVEAGPARLCPVGPGQGGAGQGRPGGPGGGCGPGRGAR